MNEISYNFFYFFLSFFFGIFGVNLILRKGIFASKILGIQFICIGYQILVSYFLSSKNIQYYPYLFRTISPVIYLYGPLGYLFQRTLLYPSRKVSNYTFLHFLPALLHTIELIPLYNASNAEKLIEINQIIEHGDFLFSTTKYGWISMKMHANLKFISITCYLLTGLYQLLIFLKRRIGKISFHLNTLLFKWLIGNSLFKISSFLFFMTLATYKVLPNVDFSTYYYLYILNHIFDAILISFNPQLLIGPSLKSLITNFEYKFEDTTKPIKIIDPAIFIRLTKYLESELAYIEPNLSVQQVSLKLDISKRVIVESIKQNTGLGFPEYINTWRINFIVYNLKNNPQWQKYSLDGIADHAGFGSRHTLYFACKKIYGVSPSEYLNL